MSEKNWKADGVGLLASIGVLVPDDDGVPESEFWTMAPEGVSVHTERVPFGDPLKYSDPPGPDHATEVLAKLQLDSIVFAYTTGSYILGVKGEQSLTARLEKRSNGIPILLPTIAAAAGFRELTAHRVALFHPPWFPDDAVQKGVEYFQSQGFEVVHASHLAPARATFHPNMGKSPSAAEVYAWVRDHTPSDAEGIFLGGNGFRSIGVIAALERDLGRPVITANQAALWYAMRLAGAYAELRDYGLLFEKNLPRK